MELLPDSSWFVPTVMVALFGLIIQGLKALWDLFISIKNFRIAREAANFQRLSIFLTVAEGIPLLEAQRSSLKRNLVNEVINNSKPNLTKILNSSLNDI